MKRAELDDPAEHGTLAGFPVSGQAGVVGEAVLRWDDQSDELTPDGLLRGPPEAGFSAPAPAGHFPPVVHRDDRGQGMVHDNREKLRGVAEGTASKWQGYRIVLTFWPVHRVDILNLSGVKKEWADSISAVAMAGWPRRGSSKWRRSRPVA